MAGVVIHHPDLRSATLVFEIPEYPYPVPFLCPACSTTHTNKAIHLRFDADGDCTVAEDAWDQLKGHLKGVVKVKKRISKPEPMVLGMNGHREEYAVVRMED